MSSVLCCHPKVSLSRSPWASCIPEADKASQLFSPILGSCPSTNILLQDQPDRTVAVTYTDCPRHWGGGSPASPACHSQPPTAEGGLPGSNFNPEEGANRSFSKLFQSDSDKQIAGSPGG